MYKVASMLHKNHTLIPVCMLWCLSCSAQTQSRDYLLFCTVKTERQSRLSAIALLLLSNSHQWSLWNGSRALFSSPLHPRAPNASTSSPTCRTPVWELCSEPRTLDKRWSMLRMVAGLQGGGGSGGKSYAEAKHKQHTPGAWVARTLDPGCQVWRVSASFWGSLSAWALKSTKRVGYQSLTS